MYSLSSDQGGSSISGSINMVKSKCNYICLITNEGNVCKYNHLISIIIVPLF